MSDLLIGLAALALVALGVFAGARLNSRSSSFRPSPRPDPIPILPSQDDADELAEELDDWRVDNVALSEDAEKRADRAPAPVTDDDIARHLSDVIGDGRAARDDTE